jgi:hypothetical protein
MSITIADFARQFNKTLQAAVYQLKSFGDTPAGEK